MVLFLIFLMTNHTEKYFHVVINHLFIFPGEVPFAVSCLLDDGLVGEGLIDLFTIKRSSNLLQINILYLMHVMNIVFQPMAGVLTL